MTRLYFIEMVRRQIYGGQPSDDASITVGLVNAWLDSAIGVAAQTNYLDSKKLDGISYINGSFYTTYKTLAVTADEQFKYKITLPHIPYGIGQNESISTLKFVGNASQISQPVIFITHNQLSFYQNMRSVPNKIIAYPEGQFVYVMSTIQLSQYTATVCMVSGGDSTNLSSVLNVPSDYHSVMIEYLKKQLMFALSVKKDDVNDGTDNTNPTP